MRRWWPSRWQHHLEESKEVSVFFPSLAQIELGTVHGVLGENILAPLLNASSRANMVPMAKM